jgi:uncharacterized membrane protein YhaH (DUF805 family)
METVDGDSSSPRDSSGAAAAAAEAAVASSNASNFADVFRAYCVIVLAVFGVVVNLACIAILVKRKRNTIFHHLLKVLAFYDLIVVVGCALLYSFPALWSFYSRYLYPRVLPWILPAVQIAMMSSVYCTILMSFERYIRICRLCQLRDCSYITKENLR